VGDEEVGIGALEDDHPDGIVLLELIADAEHLHDERHVEQVDRRVVDRHPGDAVARLDAQALIPVVGHSAQTLIQTLFTCV
jgi:hypothetical protein